MKEAFKTIVVLIMAGIIGFCIAKATSQKPQNVLVLPDISKQTMLIDSLKRNGRLHQDTIVILRRQLDSLSKVKIINHTQLNEELNKIKGFTKITRNRWIDSVYKANSGTK